MPGGSNDKTIFLIDGPVTDEPAGIGDVMGPSGMIEFGTVAEYAEMEQAKPETMSDYRGCYQQGVPSMPVSGPDTIEQSKDKADDFKDKVADVANAVQDKAQDITSKARDAVSGIAHKAQDAAQTAANKAKDAAQTIAAKAEATKATAVDAGKKSKSAVTGAAGTVGMGLWSILQRSPLQTIVFISSLVWLLRNNSATASQTPVSGGETAEKVGTLSVQVQVAADGLGAQVKTSAQQSADWFSTTLQKDPLVIGAMALVAGLGLGLAVPETAYENKILGRTRD